MQLDSYISDLLYRYDCVTIPGFGAFLTKKLSAELRHDPYSFQPPRKVLSFNEQLQNNDGLLASYIADVEKLPYDAALKLISKRIRLIKSYLVEGETIKFQNIGEIVLNNEGKMVFEPEARINYLTSSFGLINVPLIAVDREEYLKNVEEIEKVVPITLSKKKRSIRTYFKYAAIGVIALIVGGVGASAYYTNQIEAQNQIAHEKATNELDAKIQEATFVISNPLPTAVLKVDRQSGNYHVVAGAFRVEENSLTKVKQLRSLGYKARTIGENRYGLHEVVYSSYESRLEAQKALREIRRNQNPDAWLLVKELD